MAKILKFTKVKLFNQFPAILKSVTTGIDQPDDSIKKYAATVAMIAHRSMKKAPAKPKSRFGNLRAYAKGRAKYGQYYWRKGEYSRPGHPPFHHSNPNSSRSLRNIYFTQMGKNRYAIGPKTFGGTKYDLPALMEHGGTVMISTMFPYRTKRGMVKRRPGVAMANYPARPYMLPAMVKAKYDKRGANGRSFIQRQNTIGRMTPTKKAA